VIRELWARIARRRDEEAIERAVEESQMSPAEREFVEERVEDHAADLESEAHLGGGDPKRVLGD
jgi:hypothetical protein